MSGDNHIVRRLGFLLAILPHGCCVFAATSGLWAVSGRMPCHGDPLTYPTVELCGLVLALAVLLGAWRGKGALSLRWMAGLVLLAALSGATGAPLLSAILLSGLSKAGQGFLLLQATGCLMRTAGLDWKPCC